jgi:uncharacterized protein (TIRG00374 family)
MKRRWLYWLLLVLSVWLIASRFGEVQKIAATLARGHWSWLLAAVLLTVVYNLARNMLYLVIFRVVEIRYRFWELLPVMLAALFANTVAPSAGAAGAALFADDASHRGQPPARAAAGALLYMVVDYAAFALVLAAGLAALYRGDLLQLYQGIAALIFLAILGGMAGLLLLGAWQPGRLKRLLEWVQEWISALSARLNRQPPFGEDWVVKNSTELRAAALTILANPLQLGLSALLALAAHLLNLAILAALFLAFNQIPGPEGLVAGYAAGMLFWIVAITPQGIGAVEGAMAAAYTSFGVPAEASALVTLAFRGLIFWLPMGIGLVLLRSLRSFQNR